ncbi:MAG: hypothetical protein H0Z35_09140 [Thermoanaerobacteraceae bacterium]|nr:hypothetical protein [Thermoanaerobacteraceae bacterium]
MTYDEFIEAIVESEPEDWLYDDNLGLYVFQNNIAITIKNDRENLPEEFHEAWATNFPNNRAVRERFFLCYNGSIIEEFFAAAVDGHRALIPYPISETNLRMTRKNYRIGRIINIPYTNVIESYDKYIRMAGIAIEDN